jgi:hypothetical protein
VDVQPGNGAGPRRLRQMACAELRLVASTRSRKAILLATVLLGVVSAVAVVLGASPQERTFAAFSGPVQSAMSITVPFLGVLLVSDLRRPARRAVIGAAVLAALGIAVIVALFGVALCATSTAVAPSSADRWQGATTVALGSVLVQCTAQLVGTGLGLVLGRRPVVACLTTVVLPLGLWLLLGVSDVLDPARQWLTPYASALHLLSGHMSAVGWAQWLVTAAVWGLFLNLLGMRRALAAG